MNVLCWFGGHRAAEEVYNSGYYFGACARCGEPLLRSGRDDWQSPPRGHRIVWKAGRHSHSLEADYAEFLPVAVPGAVLPALPGRFASWRRDLVRLRRPAHCASVVARADEESDDDRCPRLLLMAVMLGAGLKVLLTFGIAR